MGKELKITTKYKKDLKAYKHKPDILQELNKVIDILLSGETLPEKYKKSYIRRKS
jgi:mRNA-degrading endonuclease YafQ of YafQ-DinJ toxin-antitoxin module